MQSLNGWVKQIVLRKNKIGISIVQTKIVQNEIDCRITMKILIEVADGTEILGIKQSRSWGFAYLLIAVKQLE